MLEQQSTLTSNPNEQQHQAPEAQKVVTEAKEQALVSTEGKKEVPNKDQNRKAEHQVQAHSTTNTHQQRSKRITVSLTTIRIRRYDSSSDRELAESDDEPY